MNEQVLNKYDEPATHDDCIDSFDGRCSGEMLYWVNPHTGNAMLRCAHHAIKADARQDRIHNEYLNDSVRDECDICGRTEYMCPGH